MRSKVDEVYSEIKSRLKYNLQFTEDSVENLQILNHQVEMINVSKCGLAELELEYLGATTYLMYRLQVEHDVIFDLCPKFKVWYNKNVFQARCSKKRGQVNCLGILSRCELK
jgi:hypothetical protein